MLIIEGNIYQNRRERGDIMLWLYDESIADDLRRSFNTSVMRPFVKVVDPDVNLSIAAQLQDDNISFPLICVIRDQNYQIDTNLTNFTSMHKGVATVIDNKTNNIYYEKSMPIQLGYSLNILGTNTVDVDELTKELLFKYSDMYFLTIRLPYEGERKLRFGIEFDRQGNIERRSGVLEMLTEGTLYETSIPFQTRGARLITYTPKHLKTFDHDIIALSPNQFRKL